MKVYNLNTKSNFNQQNLCITIGNFDGLHIGHQSVIHRLIQEAKKSNLQSIPIFSVWGLGLILIIVVIISTFLYIIND